MRAIALGIGELSDALACFISVKMECPEDFTSFVKRLEFLELIGTGALGGKFVSGGRFQDWGRNRESWLLRCVGIGKLAKWLLMIYEGRCTTGSASN